ncbi:MAG: P-type DNA transfer ATPase VirB11 [Methylophilaceae bacterium]|nr:P-type DNA transfer ATPase VirB11 [Methylophilaceae bacterium]
MQVQQVETVSLHRDASVQHFLQPFDQWFQDDAVTEICVNTEKKVFVERKAAWECHPSDAINKQLITSLATAVATYSSQQVDTKKPLLSAALPNGTRIQIVLPPAVENFPSLTMRKPAKVIRTVDDFEAEGLFAEVKLSQNVVGPEDKDLLKLLGNKQYKDFFKQAVLAKKNIVVSGATGSGKTTFMKGLVREIPRNERLITIEDVRELHLPHENAVHLLYSKGGQGAGDVIAKDLLECCLRMKPDRILLAELRGNECLYYVRNAASGHPGSITSCHAGTPALAFEQLAIMIQDSEGGANLTFDVIKRLLTLTIDIVVQFKNEHGKRFISEIYFDPARKLKELYHD